MPRLGRTCCVHLGRRVAGRGYIYWHHLACSSTYTAASPGSIHMLYEIIVLVPGGGNEGLGLGLDDDDRAQQLLANGSCSLPHA